MASIREAEDLMRQRTVDGILRIPVDFSRRLEQGDGRIQLLLHGADANSAATLGRYVNGALRVWHEQRVDRLGGERVQGACGSSSGCGSTPPTAVPGTWYRG